MLQLAKMLGKRGRLPTPPIPTTRQHQDDLFTSLCHEGVPFEINHAEREIRPAVIIRNHSRGNRIQARADCQTALMIVSRTLKRRRRSPIPTITKARRAYLQIGKLAPLPDQLLQMAKQSRSNVVETKGDSRPPWRQR